MDETKRPRLSNYSLNKFVAQELSDLTAPSARSVIQDFPDLNSWLTRFVGERILIARWPQGQSAVAFALLRRAQAAIEDYDEACGDLQAVVQRERTIARYFRAIRKFESAIAMAWQAYEFGRKVDPENEFKLFIKNDGTAYQRLHSIYNCSRHTDLHSLPDGHLHPVWLRNDEICADSVTLRFDEFEEQLRELGRISEIFSPREIGHPPSIPE